jgi:hypothetical protein
MPHPPSFRSSNSTSDFSMNAMESGSSGISPVPKSTTLSLSHEPFTSKDLPTVTTPQLPFAEKIAVALNEISKATK